MFSKKIKIILLGYVKKNQVQMLKFCFVQDEENPGIN
jgi:hypothetical protein